MSRRLWWSSCDGVFAQPPATRICIAILLVPILPPVHRAAALASESPRKALIYPLPILASKTSAASLALTRMYSRPLMPRMRSRTWASTPPPIRPNESDCAQRTRDRYHDSMRMTLEFLAERVQLLEDERAILQTLHQYGHAMDYGPDLDFVDCFTAEGVWDVQMRRSNGGFRCRGHAEIQRSLDG